MSGGLIRRLMTAEREAVPPSATHDQPSVIESSVAAPEEVVASERPAPAPPMSLALLKSLGPIFRAAMVYPGLNAGAPAWAAAIKRMSEVSHELTTQLAAMRPDELDVAWVQAEFLPAVTQIVSEYWLHALLKQGGVSSVQDVVFRAADILPGVVAAERALQGLDAGRATVSVSRESDLLPTLTLVTVQAQAYAALLRTNAQVEASVDLYLRAVSDAFLRSVERGADRDVVAGVSKVQLRDALLRASTGIVAKAVESAINEALQSLSDALRRGDSAESVLPAGGFPTARTVELIEAAITRLAGTYLYIAKQLGDGADGQR